MKPCIGQSTPCAARLGPPAPETDSKHRQAAAQAICWPGSGSSPWYLHSALQGMPVLRKCLVMLPNYKKPAPSQVLTPEKQCPPNLTSYPQEPTGAKVPHVPHDKKGPPNTLHRLLHQGGSFHRKQTPRGLYKLSSPLFFCLTALYSAGILLPFIRTSR